MKAGHTLLTNFPNMREAAGLIKWLDDHGISHHADRGKSHFDPSFAHNPSFDGVKITVPKDRYDSIVEQLKEEGLWTDEVPDYLKDFSQDELLEILKKPDEWSEEDYRHAGRLLAKQGMDINEAKKANWLEARKRELRTPKKLSTGWMLAGYIFSATGLIAFAMILLGIEEGYAFFPLAVLLSLVGTGMGWVYAFLKQKDPWGESFMVYGFPDQKKGLGIFLLGSLSLFIPSLYLLYQMATT